MTHIGLQVNNYRTYIIPALQLSTAKINCSSDLDSTRFPFILKYTAQYMFKIRFYFVNFVHRSDFVLLKWLQIKSRARFQVECTTCKVFA